MKIVVLLGGATGERDVSLSSGCGVARALRVAGHEVIAVDTVRGRLDEAQETDILARGVGFDPPRRGEKDRLASGDLALITEDPDLEGADLYFPTLHGGPGEDGVIQTLLEVAGLPYVGSRPIGCALAMDKDLSKRMMRDAGIPTPDWIVGAPPTDEVIDRLGLPVILKPVAGGSSVRLTLAHDRDELDGALTDATGWDEVAMCEGFVAGREVTVGIVGDEPLPVGEIIPEHELFDYACKYQPGMAQEIFPAELPSPVAQGLQRLALDVHRTLRLRDYSRVDFILDSTGKAWCLEANAIPGMTVGSLLPKAAGASGLEFPALVDRIVRIAAARGDRGANMEPSRRNPASIEGVPPGSRSSGDDPSFPG
jgi:D-alanine-D-alanine ligase